ncbi:MAG: diaminopimelate epimerase [Promethearchaeota archaeon]
MDSLIIENLNFGKYHGIGNDYIIINDIEFNIPEVKKSLFAKKLCEFHFSVGADGLIYVCNSEHADIKMRIFNDDGSEAEMCGNGIRCFCKHVYENGIAKKNPLKVETLKGILSAKLNIQNNIVESVEIDMGAPILKCEDIPVIPENNQENCLNEKIKVLDRTFNFSAVSMGNPHAVIFIDEQLDNDDLIKYGRVIEPHKRFPKRINVEFVKVLSRNEAILRVFERGVGITHSCGTGACASVVAGTLIDKFDKNKPIIVHNDGGDLIITYSGDTVLMQGPVEKSFEGKIDLIEL